MEFVNILNKAMPCRILPKGIEKQVGDISPYRQMVICNESGQYLVIPIEDDERVCLDNEPLYLVGVSFFASGQYPSDTAASYALALFGLFPDLRGTKCLCFDANEVDDEYLEKLTFFPNVEFLYLDGKETTNSIPTRFSRESLRTTYRGQVVWKQSIPLVWRERLARQEYYRRYNLMVSKVRSAIMKMTSKRDWNFTPTKRPKFTEEELENIISKMGCGFISTDFTQKPKVTPDSRVSLIDDFIEKNVSFSNIDEVLESVSLIEPDYQMLANAATIWKKIALQEKVEVDELLEIPFEELADEHAIESYIDALVNGVPLEDLLA